MDSPPDEPLGPAAVEDWLRGWYGYHCTWAQEVGEDLDNELKLGQ